MVLLLSTNGATLSVLDANVGFPQLILADGQRVYWGGPGGSSIHRGPSGGGAVTHFADGVQVNALAQDATFIYWAEGSDHSIRKLAK